MRRVPIALYAAMQLDLGKHLPDGDAEDARRSLAVSC